MEHGGTEKLREAEATRPIIGACIEVHRHLGPGLLESTYENCLVHELRLRGLELRRQLVVPLRYKGFVVDCGYRLDLVVQGRVIVEIKAVERLLLVHVLREGLCRLLNPTIETSASPLLRVKPP